MFCGLGLGLYSNFQVILLQVNLSNLVTSMIGLEFKILYLQIQAIKLDLSGDSFDGIHLHLDA